jgi:LDH2 family malate/lactate/ureidoglycolate dehydrogenase
VELLCVGLSLGDLSRDALTVKDATVCHFFGAIDLKLFGDVAAIKNKVSEILEAMRKSAKAEGQERIYIPGEKETENRAKSLRDGIQLDDATLNLLNKYAAELGVEPLA